MFKSPETNGELPQDFANEEPVETAEERETHPGKSRKFFGQFFTLSRFLIGLRALGVIGGLAVTKEVVKPTEAEAGGLKEVIIGAVATKAAEDIAEQQAQKAAQDSLEASERLNEDVELGIGPDDRLLIDDRDIEILGTTYNSRGDLQKGLRSSLLHIFSSLGLKSVTSRAQLEQESRERARARANIEIAPETIPEPATIEREDIEVTPTLKVVHSRKDLEAIIGWGRNIFSLSGFDIEKAKTVVVLDVTFWDNRTGVAAGTISVLGNEADFKNVLVGGLSVGGIRLRRDDDRGREGRAISVALGNLERVLKDKLEEKEKAPYTYVGEIVGFYGGNVFIDITAEDGLAEGTRLVVDQKIQLDKGKGWGILPDVAKLEITRVGKGRGENSTCKIVEGQVNPRWQAGYTVRPEIPKEEEPAEKEKQVESEQTSPPASEETQGPTEA
ncbi:MAG: hypothetical protein COT67_01875 [Candidatus Tagabacteria bacterium CG09_land_8_20_14_0_10_41_14]|uniref:Uncharacterized protein n=1 Tax=Candidatus Tagabacteria bacterium CG09_land_8_20_14_0_10_41_14 TaxID=1975021 RepID=A0A2H0WLF5_9BACT|nr:MAG: hypothetical protein COT67_01875 [Candidatus Tagabacteria bacterium CG09_land_8_20_14_0_10_41_14]